MFHRFHFNALERNTKFKTTKENKLMTATVSPFFRMKKNNWFQRIVGDFITPGKLFK